MMSLTLPSPPVPQSPSSQPTDPTMAAPAQLSAPVEDAAPAKRTAAPRLPDVVLTAENRSEHHLIILAKGSARGNPYFQAYLAKKTEENSGLPEDAEIAPEARMATPAFQPTGVQVSVSEHDSKRLNVKFTMTREAFHEAFGVVSDITSQLAAKLGRDARAIASDVVDVPGFVSFTAQAPRGLERSLNLLAQQVGAKWCLAVAYFGCFDSQVQGISEVTCNLQVVDMHSLRGLNETGKGSRAAVASAVAAKSFRIEL